MDELEFAQQFRPDGPVTVSQVLARQLAMPDRREIELAAAEREAEAARAERAEAVAMINAQRGNPLGEVTRAQAVVAARKDEVLDLETRLEAARGRLQDAADVYLDWSHTADEVLSAGARRSHTPDMLADAKRALAAVRVEEQLAAPPREPRGKGRGGFARRSEQPVTCPECVVVGASWEESVMIHHDEDLEQEQAPEQDRADRHVAAGRYREISR